MAHFRIRRSIVRCAASFAAVLISGGASAQETPVQLSVGETKTLELEGNPSTGYAWVLNEARGTGGQVVSVDVRGYVPGAKRSGERQRLGAPAPFQVLLTGIKPGHVSLTFDYARGGAPSAGSSRSFAVEVLDAAAAEPQSVDPAQEEAGEDPTADRPVEAPGDLFADPNDTEDGGGTND